MNASRFIVAAICAACATPVVVSGVSAQTHGPEGVRVIVNPGTTVAAVTREQLSRVFLRKVSRWDDGAPVLPVDLPESAPARDAFTRAVHHRTVGMLTGYWQRQIFSGRQLPPPDKASEAEVVAYVRETPGAIGYVSAAAELRGVRVLSITGD